MTNERDTEVTLEPRPAPVSRSETQRTLLFVLGAVASVVLTLAMGWIGRPAEIEEFGRVGEEFFPEFTDPTRATSLGVQVFDVDAIQPLDFAVERLESGRWVIPSHHDYPADAEDRLARSAASIVGIRRGAMVTRWSADHARYGVVDPAREVLGVEELEGVGRRIVLGGEDGAVLADYVIGHEVDDEPGRYYVRRPDEDEVYITALEIDLSTRFADWVDTDLLELDSWKVVGLELNDYTFDDLLGEVSARETSTFERTSSGSDWTLDGLDPELESIDTDAMRATVDALAGLELVGVRPKQSGLTPDLRLDREAIHTQADVELLQSDLVSRGFLLTSGANGDPEALELIAREGELHAATDDGLRYALHFGRVFAGTREELEIGLSSSDDTSGSEEPGEERADAAASDAVDEEADEDGASAPGRYLFVRVAFDDALLGEAPVAPIEPERPAELDAPQTEVPAAEVAAEPSDTAPSDVSEGEAPAAEPGEAAEPEDPLAEIRATYEAAMERYSTDRATFERESEAFRKRIEEGREKAERLNRRFADWYYVIAAESYEELRLSRSDLVRPAESDDSSSPEAPSPLGEASSPFGASLDSEVLAVDEEPPEAAGAPAEVAPVEPEGGESASGPATSEEVRSAPTLSGEPESSEAPEVEPSESASSAVPQTGPAPSEAPEAERSESSPEA